MNRLPAWRPTRAMLQGLSAWVALAAVVVLVVWLAARAPDDGRPHHLPGARAQVGTTYGLTSVSNPHDPAGSALVRVPTGAARVTVFTRTDEAYRGNDSQEADSDDSGSVREPSGGQLFSLVTTSLPNDGPTALVATLGGPTAEFALVLDGRRYPLDAKAGATGSFTTGIPGDVALAVGVHGTPEDVGVAVTFAGVTQTFDLTEHTRDLGRAAPLYAAATTHPRSCGAPGAGVGYPAAPGAVAAQCLAQLRRVPWTVQSGWAPAGRAWPLVSFEVAPPSLVRTPGGDTYQPDTFRSEIAVGIAGRTATELSRSGTSSSLSPSVRHFVGAVSVGPAQGVVVVVSGAWDLEAVSGSGDHGSEDEHVRWTTTLT